MEDQRGDLLPPEGLRSAARWGALFLVALAAAWAALGVWSVCRTQPGLPMWDEAAHGLAGVEVAEAIRRLDLLGFLRAVVTQSLWPFVHSLLLTPAFLLAGIGVSSAEATSVALYAGAVVLLFLAGLRLHPTRGPWIGLAAAALALLAPAYRVYGSLAFLEMPGAFLLTLAFLLHARSAEEPASPTRLAAAGWAATTLFLCKYNFGALWLAGVAWWEWEGLGPEDRARGLQALRSLARPRWWLRPVPLLLASGIVAMIAILVTGGGSFTLLGTRVSARSPGNLPYALWLLWLGWMIAPRWGKPARAAEAFGRLPWRARVLAATVFVPLAFWFTFPGHLRELVGFGANRASGSPIWTLDGLLFYPRALAAEYSPVPWLGWAALALALWPPARERRVARLAWMAFVVAFGATMLHRYHDGRFLFTTCPLVWLCAADRVAWLLSRAFERRRLLPAPVWAASGLLILAAAAWDAAHDDLWAARRRTLRAPTDVGPALDAVLAQIEPSTVDAVLAARVPLPDGAVTLRGAPSRTALLGYANGLSPGLLAWHARLHRPEVAAARLPRRVPTLESGTDAALARRIGWLDANADVVIVALAERGDSEYVREVEGDVRTLARLEGGETGWARRADARVGRFRIARFERRR